MPPAPVPQGSGQAIQVYLAALTRQMNLGALRDAGALFSKKLRRPAALSDKTTGGVSTTA